MSLSPGTGKLPFHILLCCFVLVRQLGDKRIKTRHLRSPPVSSLPSEVRGSNVGVCTPPLRPTLRLGAASLACAG